MIYVVVVTVVLMFAGCAVGFGYDASRAVEQRRIATEKNMRRIQFEWDADFFGCPIVKEFPH